MHASLATLPRLGSFTHTLIHPSIHFAAFSMGSGGVKRLLASLLGEVGGGHRGGNGRTERRRPPQPQTVELRVRLDCERCERQVKRALAGITGVEHVEVNRKQQSMSVTGIVDPHKVLQRVQSTGKKAELWPQQQNHHQHHPPSYNNNSSNAVMAHYGPIGAAQAHDRSAPSSLHPSRSADVVVSGADQITNLFSDENPNACSIM